MYFLENGDLDEENCILYFFYIVSLFFGHVIGSRTSCISERFDKHLLSTLPKWSKRLIHNFL